MTSILVILLIFALLTILVVQATKAGQLISVLKNEAENEVSDNKGLATSFALSGVVIILYAIISAVKNYHKFLPPPASEQGVWIQEIITVTLIITAAVCLITNILLFYFAYKYYYRKDRKAYYYPDNNKLELAWTAVPAIVMIALVGLGLQKWFKVFSPTPKEAIIVEATGKQFAWIVRYGGLDGILGKRDFTLVNSENELGVNWNDAKSHDDIIADEIVLPVNKPVHFKIGALDVIHNFYLPEFRMMMDAVPGVPTQIWMRPTITTEEMRKIKNDPNFDYVVACNQLCGSAHYNMKKTVRIVSEAEYKDWLVKQKSYYENVVKPAMAEKGQNVSSTEESSTAFVKTLSNGVALVGAVSSGIEAKLISFIENKEKQVDKTTWFSFDRLLFDTGKSTLKPKSAEQLNNMAEILKSFPTVELKIGGYTDNVGNPDSNVKLSDDRAKTVMAELVNRGIAPERLKAEGYGEQHPVSSNDTEEGRAKNRRIDVRVTKK
jgi:cytochrome c oxidase subunit 2